ncbi:MAG: PE family protein [Mycobacterium sp.]
MREGTQTCRPEFLRAQIRITPVRCDDLGLFAPSFLSAEPESSTTASGDLTGIGSSITTVCSAGAAFTTQVLPAAEVPRRFRRCLEPGVSGAEYSCGGVS